MLVSTKNDQFIVHVNVLHVGHYTRYRYLSHQIAEKVQASLRISYAKTRLNLRCSKSPHCSYTRNMDVDKESDQNFREHSGSVVEYLTRDRGAEGSSLTGVNVLCP